MPLHGAGVPEGNHLPRLSAGLRGVARSVAATHIPRYVRFEIPFRTHFGCRLQTCYVIHVKAEDLDRSGRGRLCSSLRQAASLHVEAFSRGHFFMNDLTCRISIRCLGTMYHCVLQRSLVVIS